MVFTLWKSANTNKSGLLFPQSSICQHATCSLPSSRLFWCLWQAILAQRSSWSWWGRTILPVPLPTLALICPRTCMLVPWVYPACWILSESDSWEFNQKLFLFFLFVSCFNWGKIMTIVWETASQIAFRVCWRPATPATPFLKIFIYLFGCAGS